MKRLLLALALSCGFVPAADASLLVIRLNADAERNRDCDAYQRALDNARVPYTLVPASACLSTIEQVDSLAVGKVNLYGSTWVAFDAIAVPGHRRGFSTALDSLATLATRPHHKPILLLSDRSNSNAMTITATACSTGVGNGLTTITNAIHAYDPRSWRTFVMGTNAQSYTTYYVRQSNLDESSFGMFRPLLGACNSGGAGTTNVVAGDSMGVSPTRVFAWARMFKTSAGAPLILGRVRSNDANKDTAAATVFASYNQSGQQGIYSIALAATAFLDSLSRGRVLRGHDVRRAAIYCEGISNWSTISDGITPTDSAFVKGMFRDSLAALSVPIGVTVNPCSIGVASKAYLRPWLASTYFYLIPQTDTRLGNYGAASRTNPTDMTGYKLNRQAFDAGDSCTAAGDTSIYCGLRAAANQVAYYYPGRTVVRAVVGTAGGQWLPIAGAATDLVTLQGGRMGADSLVSAFAKAGYRTILTNGRSDPWWSTSIFQGDGQRVMVRPVGQRNTAGLGTPTMVGDTLAAYGQTVRNWNYQTGNFPTMDWELWAQSGRSDGANDAKVQYLSRAGASVYRIYAYDLVNGAGGSAMNTAATVAPGYYETKWFVNACYSMNSYCWPGNRLVRLVRVDELQ